MQRRRRFKQALSLQDRLAAFARQVSENASKLPPGPNKESLLKKARQAETASRLDGWVAASDRQQRQAQTPSLIPTRSRP
ncbi:hypothetical protein ABIF69_004473 [Bradyrhizobium japonicum]